MSDNDTIVLKSTDWRVLAYLTNEEKGRVLDALIDAMNGCQESGLTGIESVAFWALINAQESRRG